MHVTLRQDSVSKFFYRDIGFIIKLEKTIILIQCVRQLSRYLGSIDDDTARKRKGKAC